MLHHFGILQPTRPAQADSDGASQKPFFGGASDAPTRAERELALLSGGYPVTLMPPEDDQAGGGRQPRFVSLFVPPGV